MPKPFDENKHTRAKGKFAPKGHGEAGEGDDKKKAPEKPVKVQEGNIRAAGPGERTGGSGEIHPGGERIPNAPGAAGGGLDPKKLAQARMDRDEVQGMMGQPVEDPRQHVASNSDAAHETVGQALQAIETGDLNSLNTHGKAIQFAVQQLKAKGATDEQLAPIRNQLIKLSHAVKTQDHVMAHEAAAGLKHEFFKLRHEANKGMGIMPGQAPARGRDFDGSGRGKPMLDDMPDPNDRAAYYESQAAKHPEGSTKNRQYKDLASQQRAAAGGVKNGGMPPAPDKPVTVEEGVEDPVAEVLTGPGSARPAGPEDQPKAKAAHHYKLAEHYRKLAHSTPDPKKKAEYEKLAAENAAKVSEYGGKMP